MSARPLVSTIVNNYNYGRFLREAIDSTLQQTYRNIEVIVVDDGSTDDSAEIVRSYGSRIVPIVKANAGQASAINAGLESARGEIICLLDSDDVWLPDKAAQVVAAAAEQPEAGLIYHKLQPASPTLRPCGAPMPQGVFQGSIAQAVRNSGGWWDCPATSALSFRRSLLDTIGPIPEAEFRICADAYLAYLAPLLSPVAGIGQALALYRFHDANHFSNADAREGGLGADYAWQKLLRYRTVVDSANRRLRQLQLPHGLNLDQHFAYQLYSYRASFPGHLRRDQLAWRALTLEGAPRLAQRIRYSLKVLLRGSW